MNFTISENRTKNYIKHLKSSLLFKVLAIGCSFLLIPLMIKYLGNEQYGIWSTLLSIISWIVLFDIGIGNGLRNKISESLTKNNFSEAQKYISTAYVMIGFISIILLSIFILVSNYIAWQSIFNTRVLSNDELKHVVNITAGFLLINFWLSLINQVFNGLHKSSIVVFSQFLSNFFSLTFVYLLYLYSDSSLIKLTFYYGLSLVTTNLILTIWFFRKNNNLVPKLSLYSKIFAHTIVSLGYKFFIIQIAIIVMFTTDKILITQLFGPQYVASYDVVFKLFSIITVAHSLVMAPLWSAYSDAYHRNDFEWIKKTIKNQLKIFVLFVCATILLEFFVKQIIGIWIGPKVHVDSMLTISMGLFVIVLAWNNMFGSFMNGINNLNLQVYTSIIAIIINIPMSIFMVQTLGMGTYGIIFGTIISMSLFAIFGSIQVYKIVFRRECIKKYVHVY